MVKMMMVYVLIVVCATFRTSLSANVGYVPDPFNGNFFHNSFGSGNTFPRSSSSGYSNNAFGHGNSGQVYNPTGHGGSGQVYNPIGSGSSGQVYNPIGSGSSGQVYNPTGQTNTGQVYNPIGSGSSGKVYNPIGSGSSGQVYNPTGQTNTGQVYNPIGSGSSGQVYNPIGGGSSSGASTGTGTGTGIGTGVGIGTGIHSRGSGVHGTGSAGYNTGSAHGSSFPGFGQGSSLYGSGSSHSSSIPGYGSGSSGYSSGSTHGSGSNSYGSSGFGSSQCPTPVDLSADQGLSSDATGYPESNITAEIAARTELALCFPLTTLLPGAPGVPHDPALNFATSVCATHRQTLRSFTRYGGKCWLLNNVQELITIAHCLTRQCKGCEKDVWDNTQNTCVQNFIHVSVWAFCTNLPVNAQIMRERLLIPDNCNCKKLACSNGYN